MASRKPNSYIRAHRKQSGLTQRELAALLGYTTETQISRHERTHVMPTLLMAVAYETLFRVPISELFPHVYDTVERDIEARLAEMEGLLQEKKAKGHRAQTTARKLEWFWERNNAIKL